MAGRGASAYTGYMKARGKHPNKRPATARTAGELNRKAPGFRALTDAGMRELADFRGKWLALMYCPVGSCALRAECLEGLRSQTREVGAMGGELLMLHPALTGDDRAIERALRARKPKSMRVGTAADPGFLEAYRVSAEKRPGEGVTGVFLIDPKGKLRAAARYTACGPVVVHEIAALMRTAIERFGLSGTQIPPTTEVRRAAADANYGCVEWFQYR
jgi:peroxiredoxin